jgi:hypothetical protein
MEDNLKVEGEEEPTSVFAEEGTLAHELADLELRLQNYTGAVGKGSPKKALLAEKAKLQKHELYNSEMDEHIDTYVDYVLENYNVAKKTTPDAALLYEEKTDYSHIVPEGFGTSDANIIADDLLDITDLKYGKGVRVNAKGNPQLRLYALGLLRKFELVYDIKRVRMSIVQPRLYHIDSEELTVEELTAWAEDVVKPTAEKAFKGEGVCNPGDWCRWCNAKPVCRAISDHNTALASKEFADPKTLEDDEILKVYEQIDLLVDWAKSVQGHVLKEALNGKAWKGYKLVEGRANRKWADEEIAIDTLIMSEDFEAEQVLNTKLKGIGDIEKLVGKVKFSKLDLTIKPQGKPALVPESDKRPAMGIDQAKKDFE